MLKKPKPKWWQLFALLPAMVGLLVIESQVATLPLEHQVLQLGILILIFGLIALWVRVNTDTIMNEDLKWTEESDVIENIRVDRGNSASTKLPSRLEINAQQFDYSSFKGRYN